MPVVPAAVRDTVSMSDCSIDEVRRITATWAVDATAFCEVLAAIDPSWGSETFELAGGYVVLCGPGMYVNAALAAGLDVDLTDADWERLEDRSAAVGVDPAIEITVATRPDVVAAAAARGYERTDVVAALIRDVDLTDVPPPEARFEIVPANRGLLPVWQETSACGWGHDTPERRRASDAFARAAAVVDGERFALVRHAGSGRPLGCASLTIRDGIATLGGMSTLPTERGQGVQRALIHHRLRVAAASGCDIAAATAEPGAGSERNLLRHGFRVGFTVETWSKRTA